MSRSWTLLAVLGLASACEAKFQVVGEEGSGTSTEGTGTGSDGDAGSCEVNCDDEREVCSGDQCLCRVGLERCGDTCVDIESDPAHCGSCNMDCGVDVCEGGECSAGACPDDLTNCEGACVDTEQHPLHCNGCNRPCQSNELCINANCREFEPGECASDEDCEEGRKCCPSEETESMICIEGGECP